MQNLIPVVAFLFALAVVWITSREKQAKARLRLELQKELLAKFSSSQELTAFLNSEGSRMFLQEEVRTSPFRVIKLVTAGIITLAIGAGFLFAGTDREAAALCIAIGTGILISAWITYYLARKMGIEGGANTLPNVRESPR